MASNREIVFNDWGTVIINGGYNGPKEKSVSNFLKELDKNYKSRDVNIYYREDEKRFVITYYKGDFNVVLPKDSTESLVSGEYTPLAFKLLYMALLEKEYNRQVQLKEAMEEKLKYMDTSFYDEIKTLEDHKLFLSHLEEKYDKAKTKDERDVINTLIAGVSEDISKLQKEEREKEENPFNLQYHVNRYIYTLLSQAKLLDDQDRKVAAKTLKKIILDYQRIVNDYYKDEKALKLGNPILSIDILRRIVDVEFEIKKKLRDKAMVINAGLLNVASNLQQSITSSKGVK